MSVWRLDDKRVVVTGGSRGIGRAIVEELCELGAVVLAVAREEPALEQVAHDTGCATLSCDLSEGVAPIVHWVQTHWGSLDGLVNNAGTNRRLSLAETGDEDLSFLLDINLRPVFSLCREFEQYLAQSKGCVVNITSVSAEHAVRTSTASYALTKGGMDALTRFLAATWASQGVRVNAVAPWYVRTPLAEQVLKNPEKAEAILARTPLGRVGEPREIARAVAFLMMPASAWTTGVILPVDGGFSVLGL